MGRDKNEWLNMGSKILSSFLIYESEEETILFTVVDRSWAIEKFKHIEQLLHLHVHMVTEQPA